MANPTLLDMPIAVDGDKNTIPTTTSPTTGLLSQQYGWRDINSMPVTQGGKAPNRKDFNGVFNLLSNILFYCQKGWQFEWDSSQAYYAGCIVKDTSDGKMYMCLNDITSATAPHSDTTNWKVWDLSMLANYLPLAGGTLSGDLKTSANIYKASDTGAFDIRAGNDLAVDGGVRFIGKNQGGPNAGASFFYGAKGTTPETPYIGIRSDGSLAYSPTGQGSDERDLGGSAIVAKNLTNSNGWYYKLGSGLIVQGGVTSTTQFENVTGGSSLEFTLPISFSSFYSVMPLPQVATPFIVNCVSYNISLSKMRISMDKDNSYSFPMKYVAIGV